MGLRSVDIVNRPRVKETTEEGKKEILSTFGSGGGGGGGDFRICTTAMMI